NDNFADSAAIGSLPFSASVDNTNATFEIGESSACEAHFRTVWYSFSPAADMTVRVDLAGSQVAGAVTIFLGSGSSLSDLTPVECVYTGSSTNFAVTGGQTYYLRADSFQQP